MPELSFRIEGAEPAAHSVAPLLMFKLLVGQTARQGRLAPIHAVLLRCQIRIEPAKRRYEGLEQERLRDLFDAPDRWGQTLRPMLWTHTSVTLPPFTENVQADLPVPCTFDFNVAATKYFHSLDHGEVPLTLLFSGTIFHEVENTGLQVAQIPWDREATFRLPVRVWKEMMACYYPNSAWLNLRLDVFDRLSAYKSLRGLPTWEQALESLLANDAKRGEP
jgi:Family of unknown function (DUF6084)